MTWTFEAMLARVLPHATQPESELHGVEHWQRVAQNGEYLAVLTQGADGHVVVAFAALHDSQRLNEHRDPEHGRRAALLANRLDLGLSLPQLAMLRYACEHHDQGLLTIDPTVGCCWDADRLDLPRIGTEPDPALLSTQAARVLVKPGPKQTWWDRFGYRGGPA
jgi:uncharacterized protein